MNQIFHHSFHSTLKISFILYSCRIFTFSGTLQIANNVSAASASTAAVDVNGAIPEPDYAAPINNVTVALGREAKLSCVVNNLQGYKVGWMKADTQTILSLQNKVVTHNTRISVSHEEPRTWNLHIRQIQEDDRGCYMCQINTSNMKKTTGCIDVHVPPDIVDFESSSDIKVTEGGDVSLKCVANGYPEPRIVWKREKGEKIILRTGRKEKTKVEEVEGAFLNLTRVNKRHMGAYLCIASNGVPPAVVKRIEVNVHFAPSIEVPNQLVGAPFGSDMVLRCKVEASPRPITFWQRKDTKDILMDSPKYSVNESHDSYRVNMTLTIQRLTSNDYGIYLCNARNSLGMAEDQIRTYKIEMQTQRPHTHTRGSSWDAGRGTNEVPSGVSEVDTNNMKNSIISRTSSDFQEIHPDKNSYENPSMESDSNSFSKGHHRDLTFIHIPPALGGDSSTAVSNLVLPREALARLALVAMLRYVVIRC